MDAAICTDVEPLNRSLFALARDPENGARALELLGASPQVIQRIRTASPAGIETAVHCGVPLVMFSDLLEERLSRKGSEPATEHVAEKVNLSSLSRIVLPIAYRVLRLYPDLSLTYFGLTLRGAARLIELPQKSVMALCEREEIFLQLRCPGDVVFWDRFLMIGERLLGARANWAAENYAFISLGLAQ